MWLTAYTVPTGQQHYYFLLGLDSVNTVSLFLTVINSDRQTVSRSHCSIIHIFSTGNVCEFSLNLLTKPHVNSPDDRRCITPTLAMQTPVITPLNCARTWLAPTAYNLAVNVRRAFWCMPICANYANWRPRDLPYRAFTYCDRVREAESGGQPLPQHSGPSEWLRHSQCW